jgi:tetratricopeptide (TPR) repeat protein
MRRRALLALATVALIVAACGHPPPPQKAEEDPETLAAAALEHGDYARAAALYRQAVERRPQSVSAHYGLGVASSNLSQRDDTIREFQWVVANGKPESVEVDAARSWLITAGVIRRPTVFPTQAAADSDRWNGTVEGQAYLGSSDQRQAQTRMQIHLIGQPDGPTKEERRVLRTDNDGRFRFANVVPGAYMLTDKIAGKPRWRMKIEVSPGATLRLDLNPANSTDARDDFPSRG